MPAAGEVEWPPLGCGGNPPTEAVEATANAFRYARDLIFAPGWNVVALLKWFWNDHASQLAKIGDTVGLPAAD